MTLKREDFRWHPARARLPPSRRCDRMDGPSELHDSAALRAPCTMINKKESRHNDARVCRRKGTTSNPSSHVARKEGGSLSLSLPFLFFFQRTIRRISIFPLGETSVSERPRVFGESRRLPRGESI